MTYRDIHKCQPKDDKEQESGEFDPFNQGSDDNSGRNHSEHGLKDHEGCMRDRWSVVGVGGSADAFEPRPLQSANKAISRRKSKAVSINDPEEQDD